MKLSNRTLAAIAVALGLIIAGLLIYAVVVTNQRDAARAETVAERNAHAATVANYRRAAEEAARRDAENKARVEAEQRAANERIRHDYEARIAAVREQYDRLLRERARAGSGGAGVAPVPPRGAAPARPDAAPGDNGLSLRERLVATETAIRLEELQRWVRETLAIVNAPRPDAEPTEPRPN